MNKWQPNERQREVLEEIQRQSERDGNVSQFCKDYATFSASKLSKILDVLDPKKDRSYFDDIRKPDALMEDMEDWLAQLGRKRLEHEQQKEIPVYPISTFRAVLVSVRQCKNKSTPERITKYIAPTGGSKTFLRMYLQEELKNELPLSVVECREVWRPTSRDNRERSKRTAILDIVKALGMRMDEDVRSKGVPAIEDKLMDFCTATKRLLFFDEGEFFSGYVLNLVKMLLNKTRLVVIIACTPRAHAKWNQYYADEADQIARRTHAVVQVSSVDTKDAALFFPEKQFEDPDKAAGYIATRASEFGHFSLVQRVADILEKTTRAEKKEVEDAVTKALTQMGRQDWDGNQKERKGK